MMVLGVHAQCMLQVEIQFNTFDDGASNLNVYVDEADGLIHFTNWAGADSALPFSKGLVGECKTILANYTNTSKGATTVDFSTYGIKKVSAVLFILIWNSAFVYAYNNITQSSILNASYGYISRVNDFTFTFGNTDSTAKRALAYTSGIGENGDAIAVLDIY